MKDNGWIRTHCARMDHGGCALLVKVKENEIVKIKGDPKGLQNRGYVCPKGLASPARLNHPDRLKYPLKRVGERGEGKWERISWDAAISIIRDRLLSIREDFGPEAVAFCQGMPKGLEHFVLIRLANIFGSPNLVAVQDVCHAPREISGIHTCGFYPVADLHHKSELVILWGSNLSATNEEGMIHRLLADGLKSDGLKTGTKLMVVDPVQTRFAEKADLWLRIRPGTDHLLGLAFLNVIIEEGLYDRDFVDQWTVGFDPLSDHVRELTPEKMGPLTGIDPDMIRNGARMYAAANPAAIQWGNAIEQTPQNFDAARALICLMAICGNLDVPGGNVGMLDPKILSLGRFVRADLIPDKPKRMIHAHSGTIPKLMTVPPALFKRAVLEEIPYRVRAAYIQCANPMLSWADSQGTKNALSRLDFIAVSDLFITPTAAMADIVLPAATHFEFDDMGHYGLGHGYILARPKVVEPPGECRSDMAILNELGKAMTPAEYWYDDPDEFLDAVLAPSGLTFEGFAEKGYLKGPDRFRKYAEAGFKTPSGKVELQLSRAHKFGLPALPQPVDPFETDDPDFPLILTSAKDPCYLHSSYRWVPELREKSPEPFCRIHPETADAFGISNGEIVSIETRFGKIVQKAKVTEKVLPGIVSAAYGWWFPEIGIERLFDWQRANFNMLTHTKRPGRAFGTPRLKGIPCRITGPAGTATAASS